MFEKIVVKLNTLEPDREVISSIKKITGLGISEIKNRISKDKPIVEYVLFNNDHQAIEESLVELIEQISASKNQILLYDVQENESLDDFEDISKYEISTQMLLDYFKERKSDIEKFYDRPNE